MTSTTSSFIDTLAFSFLSIPTIDHPKLLQELDLWPDAKFTFDTAIKTPGEHLYQTMIPLQDQAATTNDLCLKYLDLGHESTSAGIQQHPLSITPSCVIFPEPEPVDDESNSISTATTTPRADFDTVGDTRKRMRIEKDACSAEVDKRRRNTAASARFRAKKKLRDHVMEVTINEMTSKSTQLEERVNELEREIRWLRSLLVGEKDA